MIDEAVARQNSWLARRRAWATKFFAHFNPFLKKPMPQKKKVMKSEQPQPRTRMKCRPLLAYWFPILCALAVIAMLIYVFLVPRCFVPRVAEPTVQPVQLEVLAEDAAPTFDMVRIEPGGKVVVAGRWLPNQAVSIKVNKKIVATEQTNDRGEFVYAPNKNFEVGNYVLRLVGVDKNIDSVDDVFIYVSAKGNANSMSLLMAKDGSKFLQKPKLQSGDLAVSKIDYLENGRIVIQGNAIPRTRVTMWLDDQKVGMGHVSDHNNFGIGADVGKLEPGREYTLRVRMHDGSGRAASTVKHRFVMPEMIPGDETYYTVRRDDALWIISRNFLGRGVLYTMIVEANDIKNPDLIYPKQKLRIPIKK